MLGVLLAPRAETASARALLLVTAAVATGFAYAAAPSTLRLADELTFADEGKDIVVEGVVSSLPSRPALGARDAVAQAGYRNRYGHPDGGVAARYAEAGIALRRTDHAGALQWRMEPDGDTRHSAWRTEAVRYWHNRPGPSAEADPEAEQDPTEPSRSSRSSLARVRGPAGLCVRRSFMRSRLRADRAAGCLDSARRAAGATGPRALAAGR